MMDKSLWRSAFILPCSLLVIFLLTGGSDQQTPWFTQGILQTDLYWQGEGYRIVTAAFLHADLAHVLGNCFFLFILGNAVTEYLGFGVMLLIWLSCAVFGFSISLLTPVHATLGASGGIFGLLAASGVQAFKHQSTEEITWLGRLRSLGAVVLLLAFTAFSPRANLPAHLAGFFLGLLWGCQSPRNLSS